MVNYIICIVLMFIAFVVGCIIGIKVGVKYTLEKVENALGLGKEWNNVFKD